MAAGYGALHYMTAVPGTSHRGALPPLTPEEAALKASLERHIATIAAREHNVAHHDELEKVARYIEAALASFGYAPGRQEFLADGKPVSFGKTTLLGWEVKGDRVLLSMTKTVAKKRGLLAPDCNQLQIC